MKTRILLLLAAVLTVALLLAMKPSNDTQSREAHTNISYFVTQNGGYVMSPPQGTYAWVDRVVDLWNPAPTVTVRYYARCGLIANGVPANELPDGKPPTAELDIDTAGLDRVWYDPLIGLVGKGYQYVSTVTRVGPLTGYRNIAVPFNSAYIFSEPVNCHSTGFVGCSAVVLYDGKTLVFAHALDSKAKEAQDDPAKLTTTNLFDRLDTRMDWSGNWRCWIAAGNESDLARFLEACAARGIRVALRENIGASGHAVHWTQRTETLSIIPD